MVKALNGHTIRSYGTQSLVMRATDAEGSAHEHKIRGQAVRMKGYDLILGFPWLKQINPDIDWRQTNWRYRHKVISDGDSGIEIVDAETITNEVLAGAEAYTMTIDRLAETTQFNAANHASSDSHASGLPHYARSYADQFSEELAAETPIEGNAEHAIDLEEGKQPPFRPIYNQSTKELEALREYIQKALDKGWIQESKSPAGAPVLFTPKKDGGLRLCVDYRGINNITIKNRYPLLLLSDTLDRLSNSAIYTKLDLRDAYHRIRIKKSDQ